MAKAKGKVTIMKDVCKGCGLCTTACPVNIVKLDKEKINVKGYHPAKISEPEKCIGCGNCAVICPDVAIRVERVKK